VTSWASSVLQAPQPRDVRDAGGDGDQLGRRREALGQGLAQVVVHVDEVRRAAGDGHLVAQAEAGDLRLRVGPAHADVRVVGRGVRDHGAQPALGPHGQGDVHSRRGGLGAEPDADHGQPEGLDPVGQVPEVGVRTELVGERQQQDVRGRADLVDRRPPVREQHVLGVTRQPVAEGQVAGVAAALVEQRGRVLAEHVGDAR
jgi:hypothetical protein